MSEQKSKQFTLCVDLDAVVGDYEKALSQVVAGVKGVPVESIGPQTSWDFATCPNWPIESTEEFLDLHKIGVSKWSMFLTMPEVEGASDTLWALNDEFDVHIRIVTHRLVHNWAHDLVVADTVRWLQMPRPDGRPRVPYRDICFVGKKADVGGDLYIDDAPHNIENLRAAGLNAMVMTTGYNTHVDGLRAYSWQDVYDYVKANI
jgi:5'-nucleotidase